MKKTKRFLSIFLAVLMVLSVAPLSGIVNMDRGIASVKAAAADYTIPDNLVTLTTEPSTQYPWLKNSLYGDSYSFRYDSETRNVYVFAAADAEGYWNTGDFLGFYNIDTLEEFINTEVVTSGEFEDFISDMHLYFNSPVPAVEAKTLYIGKENCPCPCTDWYLDEIDGGIAVTSGEVYVSDEGNYVIIKRDDEEIGTITYGMYTDDELFNDAIDGIVVAPTGHKDANNDGICDVCYSALKNFRTLTTEPSTQYPWLITDYLKDTYTYKYDSVTKTVYIFAAKDNAEGTCKAGDFLAAFNTYTSEGYVNEAYIGSDKAESWINELSLYVNPPVPEIEPKTVYIGKENCPCTCTDWYLDEFNGDSGVISGKVYVTSAGNYVILEKNTELGIATYGMYTDDELFNDCIDGVVIAPTGHNYVDGTCTNCGAEGSSDSADDDIFEGISTPFNALVQSIYRFIRKIMLIFSNLF